MKKEYTIKTTKKLPQSLIEITGEIESDALVSHRPHVLEHMKEHVNLPGFRKGKIPDQILINKVGENAILEETAQHILEEITPKILTEAKAFYIDRPQISLGLITPGKPVSFTISVPVMPEVSAPDYKKIAHEIMSVKDEVVKVSEEDLNKVIDEIRSRYADSITEKGKEKVLPEVTDEFVKKLGEFKDVADFKTKVTENIKLEREHRNKEKKRISIAEKLVTTAKLDLPNIFIEQELAVMKARFTDDIARMGIKFPDYLKHINKSEEDLRTDWKLDAQNKVSLELLFAEIARIEKITPDKEILEKEVAHLIEQYPGADKERVTAYVTKQLLADQVFRFLESQ